MGNAHLFLYFKMSSILPSNIFFACLIHFVPLQVTMTVAPSIPTTIPNISLFILPSHVSVCQPSPNTHTICGKTFFKTMSPRRVHLYLDKSGVIFYYYLMKKTISIILSISLIAVLALSMTGCLMVTLRENAILERLAENEYTVMQSNSILPFSDPRMAGLKITKCFSAHKADDTINEQYDNWAL